MKIDFEDFAWKLKGQPICWAKFNEAYGYTHVRDWENDPFCERWWAFQMPSSRLYEHFYNDPDCSQIFRMGRGREQPDAITFYDVPRHDHNKILALNRIQITPWITHDVMLLQFFGITNECVEVEPDVEAMGRGLNEGQFRIEYYNGTDNSLASINAGDFGLDQDHRPDSNNGVDTLLSAHVWICRTPHYLAVCKNKHVGNFPTLASCEIGCEYFADYNADDDSLEVDQYGNYDIPCYPGGVFTFNGTASDYDCGIKVQTLTIEDKCETDIFIFNSGQTIIVDGNLTGTLEVKLDSIRNDTTIDWVVF